MSETNKVIFRTNIPEEVALKFATGLVAPTRYPEKGYQDQKVYTLLNPPDSRMYVPLPVGEMIDRLGVQPGERFLVGKMETKDGQRRKIDWVVRRIDTSQPAPQQPAAPQPVSPAARPPARRQQAPPPPPDYDYEPVLQQSIVQAQQRKAQQTVAQPGVPSAAPRTPVITSAGANGNNGQPHNNTTNGRVMATIAAGPPEPPLPEPPADLVRRNGNNVQQHPEPKTKLEDALKTVVKACHATREYAKQLSYDMPVFNGDELVRMVVTILINDNGGRR